MQAGEGPARARADESMSTSRFDALLAPRSVVVAVADETSAALGRGMVANLRASQFRGTISMVGGIVGDAQSVASFAELEPPDLVLIAAPPTAVPRLVAEAGACGARVAVVLTADRDDVLCRDVWAAAKPYGLRIVGPGSIGLSSPAACLDASLFSRAPSAGDLALISQSGTVAAGIVAWAAKRAVGFSAAITLGQACDIDVADCLDYFAGDIHTRAILLSIDVVRDAGKFMSAARAAARAKPVVVLRTGRHPAAITAAASLTHTGALARPDAVYEAAFRRAGLLSVGNLDAMFSAVETLGRQRPFPGRRLAILANGYGIGALAADQLADGGGTLAPLEANPVDLGIGANAPHYETALSPLLADPAVDAILAIHVPTARSDSAAVAEAIAATVTTARSREGRRKPVFAVSLGEDEAALAAFAKAGIPRFSTDSDAVQGFLHLVRYREAQDDLMRTPDSLPRDFLPDRARARTLVEAALTEGCTWLDPVSVAGLLAAYGIPSLPVTLAPDAEAAAAAGWAIIAAGGTVALKLVSPDIVHKSDVGGVRLDLTSEADIREAAAAIVAGVRRSRPDARITGFAVQPMVRAGKQRELIAGLAEDPVFGPVVVFGRGGTAVEVIDDRALGLPPLDLRLAQDLIDRTRVARRLAAYRDVPAVDRHALALVLVKLAQLAADLPEVRELDINPLLSDADGVVALDGRVMIAPQVVRAGERPRGAHHPRFAIRPYPVEWERSIALKGRAIRVRPVRPEDEALFHDFFAQVSAEDLRLRFFAPVRDFNHAFLARLTQLDYARAIAFVAQEAQTGTMLGAVRLHADANHVAGEYAILVRSDTKGLGLGHALMRMMIDWARTEGLERIEGSVLRENRPMLAVCRRLGFTTKADPDDAGVMKVELVLKAFVNKSAVSDPRP